jgi:hypothetical protein
MNIYNYSRDSNKPKSEKPSKPTSYINNEVIFENSEDEPLNDIKKKSETKPILISFRSYNGPTVVTNYSYS